VKLRAIRIGRQIEIRQDKCQGAIEIVHPVRQADGQVRVRQRGDSRVRAVSRTQVRQPVNARGLGRWLIYRNELTPLVAELETADSLRDWPAAPRSHTEQPHHRQQAGATAKNPL
jgi:hypothetical protein